MTLFHVAAVFVLAIFSSAGLVLFHQVHRNPFHGSIVGFLAGMGLMLSVAAANLMYLRFRPPMPRCRSGRCSYRDFRFHAFTPAGTEMVCKCGEHYLKSLDGAVQSVWIVGSDGSVTFYRERRGRGVWTTSAATGRRSP